MRIFTRISMLAVFLWASPDFHIQAQTLSFGVEGGVPAETPLQRAGTSKVPFAIGPTLTVGFTPRISLQTGVLFYRFGETHQAFGYPGPEPGFTFGSEDTRARSVEIPLLLKYTFLSEDRTWRPFVSAGPAVRRTSIESERYSAVFSGSVVTDSTPLGNRSDISKWKVDPVFGAGVSFRSGRFTLEPQARYSYWNAGKHSPIRQNQVQFLFGLRF